MAKIKDVPTADLGTDTKPLEHVQYDARYNVFANERRHSEQPKSISNTCVVEKVDCNVIPNSSDMCDNNIQTDQNAVECDDERVALANLIANLKLDTGQFRNLRTVTIAEARETIGSLVVQQTRIQCFNYKEFDHFAKECRKPKRVKDSTYHKEKMLLCKQAEKEAHYSFMAKIKDVPTADLGTDTKPLEHVQYDARYNVFANERRHSEQPKSISNTCVVEKVDCNVIPNSSDMCDNNIQTDQNAVECDDERVALANLIANLKLDVDENKKI
nr:hypothetical protein [Tanacetum cinerariifolium]